MNILILSWRSPKHPNAGGAEISTHEHAKVWVKAGHNVVWFSSFFKGANKAEIIDGVNIRRDGRQFFDVQLRAFFWYLFGHHPKFDLVVDQFHGLPFFTPLFVRVKKLAFIHEVAKEVWGLNPWPKPFNLLPAAFGPVLEPLIFVLYKNVPFMTVSQSTKNDLTAWGISKDKVTIIHNGVTSDLTQLKEITKERKKTALYLGAVSWDKGIEDALKSFAEINKRQTGWQFWVVGKASDFFVSWMRSEIKKLGLSQSFKYWGFTDEKKKFELLSKSHILLNPSYHEGWGLVNIEANSVETPVVGYDVDGTRDSVKHGQTGLLCKAGDYRSLAENAIKLVNEPELYGNFRKNCKAWSKKFAWKKATSQSLRLLETL